MERTIAQVTLESIMNNSVTRQSLDTGRNSWKERWTFGKKIRFVSLNIYFYLILKQSSKSVVNLTSVFQ